MTRSTGPAPVVSGALLLAALGTGWWRAQVFHTPHPQPPRPSWEHVHAAYPLPQPVSLSLTLSSEMVDAIMDANPFSPQRRVDPARKGQSETAGSATEIPKPKFIYKGRIQFGQRQRAIVEEVTTHKTHFLEVGQEVTGFKVLDISENQVLLSDPAANEPLALPLSSAAQSKPSETQTGEASRP